ncbi:MAG: GTPase HflX, partial [Candidatus Kuenenia stuttgartiensis]|nr:GTPase HflX [Candidatus Kuenenia stuttgartiensis]
KQKIAEILEKRLLNIEISCSQENGKLIATLHENAHILNRTSDDRRLTFHLQIEDKFLSKLLKLHDDIQIKELVP